VASRCNFLRPADIAESNPALPQFRKRTSSLGNFVMGPDGAATTTEDTKPPNLPEIEVDDRTPYEVLKIKEKATPEEIKARYRKLSRKYHPDTSMRGGILPGNCNNEEEVREEWYRIKDSYELLSDRKTRLRYDRKLALDDPAAAMGKAAINTLSWGIAGLGVGLFKAGEMAVKNLNDRKVEGEERDRSSRPDRTERDNGTIDQKISAASVGLGVSLFKVGEAAVKGIEGKGRGTGEAAVQGTEGKQSRWETVSWAAAKVKGAAVRGTEDKQNTVATSDASTAAKVGGVAVKQSTVATPDKSAVTKVEEATVKQSTGMTPDRSAAAEAGEAAAKGMEGTGATPDRSAAVKVGEAAVEVMEDKQSTVATSDRLAAAKVGDAAVKGTEDKQSTGATPDRSATVKVEEAAVMGTEDKQSIEATPDRSVAAKGRKAAVKNKEEKLSTGAAPNRLVTAKVEEVTVKGTEDKKSRGATPNRSATVKGWKAVVKGVEGKHSTWVSAKRSAAAEVKEGRHTTWVSANRSVAAKVGKAAAKGTKGKQSTGTAPNNSAAVVESGDIRGTNNGAKKKNKPKKEDTAIKAGEKKKRARNKPVRISLPDSHSQTPGDSDINSVIVAKGADAAPKKKRGRPRKLKNTDAKGTAVAKEAEKVARKSKVKPRESEETGGDGAIATEEGEKAPRKKKGRTPRNKEPSKKKRGRPKKQN